MTEEKAIVGLAPLTIAERLTNAQLSAKAVAKDAQNKFHNYKYASAEAVIEEARGPLAECGLALVPMSWRFVRNNPEDLTGINEPGHAGTMFVKYRLFGPDMASVEFDCETAVIVEKGRPLDKAQATALTYNMGYFLRGLLLLPREDASSSVDARDNRNFGNQPPAENQSRRPALIGEIQRLMKAKGLNTDEGKKKVAVLAAGKSSGTMTDDELSALKDKIVALEVNAQ